MISINYNKVNVGHFPDGTQHIVFPEDCLNNDENQIEWFYDTDEELFTLASAVDYIRRVKGDRQAINLFIPYLQNARMDRIKSEEENFSLKVFANFINSFKFNKVFVYNVHSTVSEALINNVVNIQPEFDIECVVDEYKPDVIFFPDEGACKRYSDLTTIKNYGLPVAFGIKKRDWKTGQIQGLEVITDTDLTDKKVLIIDDICSAGGTFKFSSMQLKELGASDVALYVSHCEDNIENGNLLSTELISNIYTTDSILHIEHPKLNIVRTFRNFN